MKKIVLANRNSYRETLEEEKYIFLRFILTSIGIPIEDCMPENISEQTVENRVQLRKLLQNQNLFLREPSQDTMQIYFDGDVIANFKKPLVILKEDLKEIDQTKRKYLEIHFEYEHPFEAGEE